MKKALPLHPLLNDNDSPHYQSEGEPAIVRFERKYTVTQLMNWAEITKEKYNDPGRKNKGEVEKDIRKLKTYDNYFKMLESLVLKEAEFADMKADQVYKKLNIYWRYR